MSDFFDRISWGKIFFMLAMVVRGYSLKLAQEAKFDKMPVISEKTYRELSQPQPITTLPFPGKYRVEPWRYNGLGTGPLGLGLSHDPNADRLITPYGRRLLDIPRAGIEPIK